MKLNRIKNTLIILLASSIFFISCSGPKNVESDENEHASKEGEEDPLKLTKEQMQAVGIVTGKIEYKKWIFLDFRQQESIEHLRSRLI